MASIQARDVTTAPVTAPADAKTEEQVPETFPERRPHSAGEKDMFVDIDMSKETAKKVKGLKLFTTNVMFHDAVRSKSDEVVRQVFALRDDTID